jgi:hypothetical protein
MTEKVQYLMAGQLLAGLAALSLGALIPLPAFAADNGYSPLPAYAMGSGTIYPRAPHLEPRLAPEPKRLQVAESAQSTNSSASASASASSSASSSVTVSGGKKPGKCTAEASAHAKANDVEKSDHDMKVVEGQGCSAKAESSATVKPQKQQSE